MARTSTIACRSLKHVSPITPHAANPGISRQWCRLLPLVAALHGGAALAADIARDTPAASMALAQGLYATPGPSASVSSVATPTITASPLPSAPAPAPVAATVAAAAASAAAPIVTAAPAKAPETDWTGYVAIIAGIVGALAGIAGAIMGGLALRSVSRQKRRD
ncbi:hypothetical protein P3T43_002957 [Paraburkholderia sp. GAS41]|jgi:hypothetical protein|uniref:hypothetical protein n=1 Tax=Paraburkholderia sp. GAS41 TaxID=3035134 RepID=UPI003D203A4E